MSTQPERRELAALLCAVLERAPGGCDAMSVAAGPPTLCYQQADALLAAGYRASRIARWSAVVRDTVGEFWRGWDEADSPPHYGRPPLDS